MVGQSGQTGGRRWYVSVDGKVYGPFDEPTLWSYVQEGRVTAQSLVSTSPSGPFGLPRDTQRIAHWFPADTVAQTKETTQSVHLIMADIRSNQSMAFLQTLQSLGTVERLGDAVWLIQTRLSLEETRRTLGPTLSTTDRLFLMDASAADYATINLSVEAKARVAALYDQAKG